MIENLTNHTKIFYDIALNQNMEILYIHSLYGGRQVEVYKLTPLNILELEMMKFENYDALMYYFSVDVKGEYYENHYWIMPSKYKTKSILFVLPLIKTNFSKYIVKINNREIRADEIGCPGDKISIYPLKKICPVSLFFLLSNIGDSFTPHN